jgi:hypothetical protein
MSFRVEIGGQSGSFLERLTLRPYGLLEVVELIVVPPEVFGATIVVVVAFGPITCTK